MPTRIGVLVVSLWVLSCGSSSDGGPVDAAGPPDAVGQLDDAASPDAAEGDVADASTTPDADLDAVPTDPADAGLDARSGPCTVEPTGQACLDCLGDIAQECAAPCADEGAALVTCGVLRGCCANNNCDPACLQRECPTQVQAAVGCLVDSCRDDGAVCF